MSPFRLLFACFSRFWPKTGKMVFKICFNEKGKDAFLSLYFLLPFLSRHMSRGMYRRILAFFHILVQNGVWVFEYISEDRYCLLLGGIWLVNMLDVSGSSTKSFPTTFNNKICRHNFHLWMDFLWVSKFCRSCNIVVSVPRDGQNLFTSMPYTRDSLGRLVFCRCPLFIVLLFSQNSNTAQNMSIHHGKSLDAQAQ